MSSSAVCQCLGFRECRVSTDMRDIVVLVCARSVVLRWTDCRGVKCNNVSLTVSLACMLGTSTSHVSSESVTHTPTERTPPTLPSRFVPVWFCRFDFSCYRIDKAKLDYPNGTFHHQQPIRRQVRHRPEKLKRFVSKRKCIDWSRHETRSIPTLLNTTITN